MVVHRYGGRNFLIGGGDRRGGNPRGATRPIPLKTDPPRRQQGGGSHWWVPSRVPFQRNPSAGSPMESWPPPLGEGGWSVCGKGGQSRVFGERKGGKVGNHTICGSSFYSSNVELQAPERPGSSRPWQLAKLNKVSRPGAPAALHSKGGWKGEKGNCDINLGRMSAPSRIRSHRASWGGGANGIFGSG